MEKNDEKIDIEKLQADVNKIDKQYKCNQSGWWTKFFNYLCKFLAIYMLK